MQKQISILNSVSGAANCVTTNGTTVITGLTPFKDINLESLQIYKNLVATPNRWTYSIPLVSNGVVSFRMTQTVDNLIKDAVFYYEFAATASSASLKSAIDAWYLAQGFEATNTVTAASPTTGVLLSSTSNINIQMYAIEGLTVDYAMPTLSPNATAATAVSGTTTVTVAVLTGQTWSTGEVVNITGATGYTFTQNGISVEGSVQARITYASGTTFTLNGVTGSGTNTGTIVITKVAQVGFGDIASVNADSAQNGSDQVATQTTYQYNCAQIVGTYPSGYGGTLAQPQIFEATLWYPANLIASPFTAFTNTAALETALSALVV